MVENPNEITTLTASSINFNTASTPPLNLTITSSDTPPTVTLSAPNVEKGNGPVNMAITLDHVFTSPVTLNFGTSGTAVKGTDYTLSAESVTIPAGSTSATVQIIPINDDISESQETIIITVSSATNAATPYPTITRYLNSEDYTVIFPTVTLSASNTSIPEANGTTTVTATIPSGRIFPSIIYFDASGTATFGTDYTANSNVNNKKIVAGGNGAAHNAPQLNLPHGVFVDANGNIFIADKNNHRVQKWAPGATSGVTAAGKNGQGNLMTQLNNPTGVYVTTNGDVYIADTGNNRIQKWAAEATSGITVAGGNGAGSAANQFNAPSAVFVDTNENIFVADQNNHRIQKWTPGSLSGTTEAGGNGAGDAANQLNLLADVFVDTSGNIFIADQGNHRIQKWASGASTGTTVAGGNGNGNAANQFRNPGGIYVDTNDNLFIADKDNNRIQKWTSGAVTGTTIATGIEIPVRVTGDSNGNIYFSEFNQSRVQKIFATPQTFFSAFFEPNATTASFVITGVNDAVVENPDETFTLTASSINFNTAGTSPLNLTITSNDIPPTISLSAPNIGEATGPVNLNISLDHPYTSAVTVNLSTSGTAVKGTDYTLSAESVTIPAGNTLASIEITPINDNIVELQETIIFTVSSATNAATPYPSFTTNLSSDDVAPPTISLSAPQQIPEEGGAVNLEISLSNISGSPITINLSTSGEAIKGTDYTLSAESVTFQPQDTVKNVLITPINDNTVETLEAIVFSVSSATNAVTPYPSINTSISSEDKPNAGITLSKTVMKENDAVTVRATLSAPTSREVRVNFAMTGTAKYYADYTVDFPEKGPTAIAQTLSANGVAIDTSGNIFVSETSVSRVKKVPVGTSTPVLVTQYPEVSNQEGIFIDTTGNLYIADKINHRIRKLTPGASTGITVAGGNGSGSAANQLNYPSAVFVDSLGNIYIADKHNHRIQKWAPGATSGVTVAGGNGLGNYKTQLNFPNDIFVDKQGTIYIDDQNNHRVQKWLAGATEGTTVAGGNGAGGSIDKLNYPNGIYVDSLKNIFIADGNNRIVKWVEGDTKGSTVVNISASRLTIDKYDRIIFVSGGQPSLYKFQYQPQIIIPAGASYGEMTINSIEDGEMEGVETIVLNTKAVTNGTAVLGSMTIQLVSGDVPAQPGAFTTSSSIVCKGQNNVVYTVPPVSNATSYIWTYSGIGATFSSTTNTVSIDFSGSATSGALSVKAQNLLGTGPERTIFITVGAPTQPTAFSASTQYVCAGQNNIVYTVPSVTGATSYTWAYSDAGASFSSTTNTVSINFSPSATSGVLSVKASNTCGLSDPLNISVSIVSTGTQQNIVLNGPLTINNQVTHIAQKSVSLIPTSSNPISINQGAVFLAAIATCSN